MSILVLPCRRRAHFGDSSGAPMTRKCQLWDLKCLQNHTKMLEKSSPNWNNSIKKERRKEDQRKEKKRREKKRKGKKRKMKREEKKEKEGK